jgi:16S rRNA processing protein RimM
MSGAGQFRNPKPNSPGQAGSSSNGGPAYLVVGKLRHTHGLKGEILLEVITDFPERLQPNVRLFVGDELKPVTIRSRRSHGQGLLLGFYGYDTPEAVGVLRNQLLYVPSANRPQLPEGEYYHHQLLGLAVIDEEGRQLGQIGEIVTTPANDVYVVRRVGSPDLLLPAIAPVVLRVDLEKGEMHVHLLPGLLEE